MIHVKLKVSLSFKLFKAFKSVPKRHPRVLSPKQSHVDDSCLYSRKIAETIIKLLLTSFTKTGVGNIKQEKLTAPLNSAYSN